MILKDDDLYNRCQTAEKTFVQDVETLVNIESPTGHYKGLIRIKDIIVDKLTSLGAEIELYPAGSNAEGGYHLSGTIRGSGQVSFLLLAHMDTVGLATHSHFRIGTDNFMYGSGVADNKGNIVLALSAITILNELGFTDYSKITLFSNCDEENDSSTSRELIIRLAQEHDYVFCLEAGRPGDALVVSRAANGVFEMKVAGRTAHASAPREGCNAADELAHLVLALNKLADAEKETIITTRIIESGTANHQKSVVPDYASGLVRLGAYSSDELARVLHCAADLARHPANAGTKVTLEFQLDFPLFPTTDGTANMADLARAIYAGLGQELKMSRAPGGADSCWAATVNPAVLDGVGIVSNGKVHTDHEGADLASIVPRLYLFAKMLMELCTTSR